ncbi:MAG: sugar phosphate nucleotidyltransferase, partial [Chthoniobacterales bacterium]
MAEKSSMPEAVILAGGLGTRLQSEVPDRPKPLAWVGGRYFLSHILSQLADAGVRRVVVAAGYLGEHLRQAFAANYQGMEILYSFEEKLMGTGGALRQAVSLIKSNEVLVLNGDSFCETNLSKLVAQHRSGKNAGTLVVRRNEREKSFGHLKINENGAILDFEEKPASEDIINAGIYVLYREIVNEIPADEVSSLERDVFPDWAKRGLLGAFETQGAVVDIGTPETL